MKVDEIKPRSSSKFVNGWIGVQINRVQFDLYEREVRVCRERERERDSSLNIASMDLSSLDGALLRDRVKERTKMQTKDWN